MLQPQLIDPNTLHRLRLRDELGDLQQKLQANLDAIVATAMRPIYDLPGLFELRRLRNERKIMLQEYEIVRRQLIRHYSATSQASALIRQQQAA